jgi:hypothetical protein
LTDEQIAVKVARGFFEALIAEDYKKAGQLYEGIPEKHMKEMFGGIKFARIVEVGQPTPHSRTRSLHVPVKVEMEAHGDGKARKTVREFQPMVRPVHQQPNRRTIIGGI